MTIGSASAVVVAVVLALSAGGKAASGLEAGRASAASLGVPSRLAGVVARALVVVEAAVAAALVTGSAARPGAIAASFLLVTFTILLAIKLRAGEHPACNCFGAASSEPISWRSIGRNVVLLALAGIAAATPLSSHPPLAGEFVASGAATVTWWLGLLVVGQGSAIRVLRRVSMATAPASAGLPVGSLAPPFELQTLDGARLSTFDLGVPGRPALLVFVQPSCRPCRALLPELAAWGQAFEDAPSVILISSGTTDETEEEVHGLGLATVLVEGDEAPVTRLYSIAGTPSAVFVDASGVIAEPTASGAPEIRKLLSSATTTPTTKVEPLPLGSEAPFVELPDAAGKLQRATFGATLSLVVAWSTDCPYCEQLAPWLSAWSESASSAGQLVVLAPSSDLAPSMPNAVVLIDEGGLTRRAFGLDGTPTALLVDAEARVASEPAEGAAEVRSLAERMTALSRAARLFGS